MSSTASLRLADIPNTDDVATVVSSRRPVNEWSQLTGQRLVHFLIGEPIGVGGSGAVFRAMDESLDRPVAIKVLAADLAANPEFLRRFQLEARAAARLDHENIARAYYSGADRGWHFIAFEFVEGVTLKEMIGRRGALPVSETIRYLQQLAQALEHAGSRGIVHRDVKPSNVIITPDGHAKLVDMGLARLDGPADGMTRTGATLGTFDYISPEQALEPRSADSRSDLYSLGCTIYHALTGRSPTPEGTAARKLAHHQNEHPTDPRDFNPEISDALVRVLERMMAKDPARRYASPNDLLQALTEFSGKESANRLVPAVRAKQYLAWRPLSVIAASVVALVVAMESWRRSNETASALKLISAAVPIAPASDQVIAEPPMNNEAGVRDVATVAELIDALRADTAHIRLTARVYEIPTEGLSFAGRQLTLEAVNPFRPPELRMSGPPSAGVAGLISFRGPTPAVVNLRGLHFAPFGGPTNRSIPTVYCGAIEKLSLELCTFTEAIGETPQAHIALPARNSEISANRPAISASTSVFNRGGPAVQIGQPAALSFSNCAFDRVAAILDARGSVSSAESTCRLDQCTAVAERSGFFRFHHEAGAAIQIGHSVLSGLPSTEQANPSLVQQFGSKRGDVEIRSLLSREGVPLRNAYFGLLPFWTAETGSDVVETARTPDECSKKQFAFFDSESFELPASPFASNVAASRPGELSTAFVLDDSRPELRAERNGAVVPLGVQFGAWGQIVSPSRHDDSRSTHRTIKVIDANKETSAALGVYRTLAQALPDVRPGDSILIRSNEVIAVEPIRLERPDLQLTIAAFPGYRPELQLSAANQSDVALFTIAKGRLTLQQLHIAVRNSDALGKPRSLANVLPGAACYLQNCVVTLADQGPSANSVFSSGPGASGDEPGTIRIDNSFLRGQGHLVGLRSSNAIHVETNNMLAVLDGSLLFADGNLSRNEVWCRLQFRDTTAIVTQPLVSLYSSVPGSTTVQQPVVRVSASSSSFVAAGDQPLLGVTGVDTEDSAKALLAWSSDSNVVAANFSGAMAGFAVGNNRPLWNAEYGRWAELFRDPGLAFARVRNPLSTRGYARVTPRDCRFRLLEDRRSATSAADLETGARWDRLPQFGDSSD